MRTSRLFVAISLWAIGAVPAAAGTGEPARGLQASVAADGHYSLGTPGSASTLTAGVAAQVNGRWLRLSDYPRHDQRRSETHAELGAATQWDVTASGLPGSPDLLYRLRVYHDAPYADIQVTVRNGTGREVAVSALRTVDAAADTIDLGGPEAQDRVLSDSFSEDRPAIRIRDLGDPPYHQPAAFHRAVGSQLLYNRQSRQSLFIGALTSERFLTILRLRLANAAAPRIGGLEVESTGTTEMEKENSLQGAPAADQVPLVLPVAAGATLSSERVLIGTGGDYHDQLETYGALIRRIHGARVSAPPLIGWWSWTAYYFGLNSGAALTNAEWEAQHLLPFGYTVFHIDEGYQYARGEYATADASLFPNGLTSLEYQVRGLGLTPGIWTAPFEVSERSWLFQHHPDWLIKNAQGQPIKAGFVVDGKDQLYMLDPTNPGAADYLRQTYATLVHEWGIHYIKLDFMDDSAIEGVFYRPHTTAMEAQRIGLGIIRAAVGDDVYLDKDGSVMLNPVGLVDYGRLSQDTGHTFSATAEAEPGIAARYYMNRTFFVADPDAFAVSTQTIADQSWHESRTPSTLGDARAAIALAAVTGGMFEVGDNLPTLEHEPERLALLTNRDLLAMIRLGRSSRPVDLMDYAEQDRQPTTFVLAESPRQSIVTVFNWTKKAVDRRLPLTGLGLSATARYRVSDVLEPGAAGTAAGGELRVSIAPESVRMVKLVDPDAPATAPAVRIDRTAAVTAGQTLALTARQSGATPAIGWDWSFGDGTAAQGQSVRHAWTEPGDYLVTLTAIGIDGGETHAETRAHVTGRMATTFDPARIRRP